MGCKVCCNEIKEEKRVKKTVKDADKDPYR